MTIRARLDRYRKGNSVMILFPAMMVGGHLLIAVVDKVPDLNFEPICRGGAGESFGGKDEVQVCIEDESAARDALAKQWAEFASADRTRCVRLSTMNRTASYVEVLTCLEMDRDAKKLRQTTNGATDWREPSLALAPAPEKVSPPVPSVRLSHQPVSAPPPPPPPLPLEPRAAPLTGLQQIFCVPGLKSILPACISSGARP